jgi:hypothetical protein
MWVAMLDASTEFRKGSLTLDVLVETLRGLFGAADPHDMAIRSEFGGLVATLDDEHDLRTKPWRTGATTDEGLWSCLDELETLVRQVLASDATDERS